MLMGQFIVSTFGKWESQRKELIKDLLADPNIYTKTSEFAINTALLNPVHSAMYELALNYIREHTNNIQPTAMRQLVCESYQLSLTVVLKSLSNALNIPEELLSCHTEKFCVAARESIEAIIDDILKLGQLAVQIKNKAIDTLYGSSFKTIYPELAQQLFVQDEELSELARKGLEQQINPLDFGKNESIIREHLIYIHEISIQMKPSEKFQTEFLEKIRKTQQQYKIDIRLENIRKQPRFLSDIDEQKPNTGVIKEFSTASYGT
jgi:hypothetical protein